MNDISREVGVLGDIMLFIEGQLAIPGNLYDCELLFELKRVAAKIRSRAKSLKWEVSRARKDVQREYIESQEADHKAFKNKEYCLLQIGYFWIADDWPECEASKRTEELADIFSQHSRLSEKLIRFVIEADYLHERVWRQAIDSGCYN